MTQYRPCTPEELSQLKAYFFSPKTPGHEDFMAKALDFHARQQDVPAFEYFLEFAAQADQKKAARADLPQAANDAYQDFMTGFIDVCDKAVASREQEGTVELSEYELFFGDIDRLDAKQKRLRTLFFNSPRYRRSRFHYSMTLHGMAEEEVDDIARLERKMRHYHDEYFDPTPRKGEWVTLEMQYDRFFGPRELLTKRQRFYRDQFFIPGGSIRRTELKHWGLPEDATDEEARIGLLALCEKHKKAPVSHPWRSLTAL